MRADVYTCRSMKRDNQDLLLFPAFKALADLTRLKILLMLEGKPRTVGEIVEFFDLTQPTITRHLQSLLEAGLVIRQKKAQKVYYSIDPDNIQNLCQELVACFPCCCVTIKPMKKTASKHSVHSREDIKKDVIRNSRTLKKQGVKT